MALWVIRNNHTPRQVLRKSLLDEAKMIVVLTEQLALAGTLVLADIAEIGRRGYQTLIDLRTDGEPAAGGLSPAEVRQHATALGLAYRQIPVSVPALNDATVETVRCTLWEAKGPILLHYSPAYRACSERKGPLLQEIEL
jgi:uncharacterized protein (TIGR01244 family)